MCLYHDRKRPRLPSSPDYLFFPSYQYRLGLQLRYLIIVLLQKDVLVWGTETEAQEEAYTEPNTCVTVCTAHGHKAQSL